ncbi:Unknown protein, partial [Striga hermonthica]
DPRAVAQLPWQPLSTLACPIVPPQPTQPLSPLQTRLLEPSRANPEPGLLSSQIPFDIISQNVITYSVMLNLLNIQMPPRREPNHQAPTQATVVAQFRDYHAEKFSGQGDPRIVDEWIQGLEFIFEIMDCPDRYRVVCAQLQLTGDARLWWNAYWSMRPGEKAGCTWDMLKKLVREKYYPAYYRAEMERQFLALQQGIRMVDEYEREFTRLAAFIPDLVRTEAQRAQWFIDGLYPAVRHDIIGHGTQTYARA